MLQQPDRKRHNLHRKRSKCKKIRKECTQPLSPPRALVYIAPSPIRPNSTLFGSARWIIKAKKDKYDLPVETPVIPRAKNDSVEKGSEEPIYRIAHAVSSQRPHRPPLELVCEEKQRVKNPPDKKKREILAETA